MTAETTTGVLICGHGSRDPDTVCEFMALVRDVAVRLPQFRVQSGLLEFASPSIRDGLEELRQAGCARILVIPGTLFSAGHARQDIPSILKKFAAQFPELNISYGRAFDVDPYFVRAASARIFDAVSGAGGSWAPEHTALLVVGRGASDPEALASMQAVARLIQTEIKFTCVETAYAGIAPPSVSGMLEHLAGQSYNRLIILPYFLFTGMLVKRLYDEIDLVAARYPATQFVKSAYLNNHPWVIDGFARRIIETNTTGTRMHG